MSAAGGRCVLLSGGGGGAKLACGLAAELGAEQLLIAANTGDDFEHMGLRICPDLDSIMYALAGRENPARGWGLADESWRCMEALRALGGETWFQLGDLDLATHLARTHWLGCGNSLSWVVERLCEGYGVRAQLIPMSDDPVRTKVDSDIGELSFQDYFVRHQCEPAARGFRFDGAESARPHPVLMAWLEDANLRALVIGPSNPYVSVDPILSLPGVREAIANCAAPVIAVSPLVGGRTLKGPAARMMREQGTEPTNAAIAAHYRGLIDGLMVDEEDAGSCALTGEDARVAVRSAATVMRNARDRRRLAGEALRFADDLRAAR